jgi:hypothetical protein
MVTGKIPFPPLQAKTISPHHKPAECNVGVRKMTFFGKIHQETHTAISIPYLFRRKSFKIMFCTLKKNPGFYKRKGWVYEDS